MKSICTAGPGGSALWALQEETGALICPLPFHRTPKSVTVSSTDGASRETSAHMPFEGDIAVPMLCVVYTLDTQGIDMAIGRYRALRRRILGRAA